MPPEDWLKFVQIDPFPRLWERLGLNDDDLRALEIGIMAGPDRPPQIPGSQGLRKLRFTTPRSAAGKRGSYRVYYAYFANYGTVLLMAVLAKNDQADLTKADVNALAKILLRIEKLLERGETR